jgi:hypothetical protein
MRKLLISLGILALAGLPRPAAAAALLAVDVDPGTPGVQGSLALAPGESFGVDILISGLDAATSLHGFEFDLDFAPSVLSATSVVDGGFLLAPVFAIETDLAAPDVNFAEVTLGAGGAVGSGVLARLVFQTLGEGTSALTLGDVILSHVVRPGVVEAIPIEGITNASVRVEAAGGAVVPEPTGALLFSVGSLVVGSAIRSRAKVVRAGRRRESRRRRSAAARRTSRPCSRRSSACARHRPPRSPSP